MLNLPIRRERERETGRPASAKVIAGGQRPREDGTQRRHPPAMLP